MAQEQSHPSSASGRPITDAIAERLNQFEIFRPNWLRLFVKYMPTVVVIFLLGDFLVGSRFVWRDTFRASCIIVALIDVLIIYALFAKTKETLRSLWQRKLIHSPHSATTTIDAYRSALDGLQHKLNSSWSWIIAALASLIGLASTYPARYWVTCIEVSPEQWSDKCAAYITLGYYTWQNYGFIAGVFGFLFGVLIWRVGVISWFAGSLSDQFSLQFRYTHPDQSAGYRPFSEMCLLMATAFLLPMIFLAILSLGSDVLKTFGFRMDVFDLLWSGFYKQWLFVLIIASAIWFFWGPTFKLHQKMQASKAAIEADLDALESQTSPPPDQPRSAIMDERTSALSQLRTRVEEHFSLPELMTLCFDLGVDYENVAGDTKAAKATALVQLLDRDDRLADLVTYCQKVRDTVTWNLPPEHPQRVLKVSGLAMGDDPRRALDRIPTWPMTRGMLLLAVLSQTTILFLFLIYSALA